MKNTILKFGIGMFLTTLTIGAFAQRAEIGYIRPNDKRGVNVFETSKTDSVAFKGVDVRIGGNFAQSLQNLKHSNTADVKLQGTPPVDVNTLTPISNGFNTAMANLNIDVALADGISLNLVTYLSTRHHNETWVKGGFIQFEKLPFLKNSMVDRIMEFTTIRVGHMEVNYGDAHFRRSDAGNTFFNPFMEGYILDAFTTEIGGDIMFRSNGAFLLGGVTGGEIKGDVNEPAPIGATPDDKAKRSPSFIGKIGYDKQVNEDLRVRVSASGYYTASSASNTLFSGDRAGSHYFMVMEYNNSTSATLASGRLNPGFSDKVLAMMGNLFVKYDGLEFFGTYENAKGRSRFEASERKVNQFAGDILYRFGGTENFYVGGRYNQFKGELAGLTDKVTIDRMAAAAGWNITPNMLVKAEYVIQKYKDFPTTDIRNGGEFKGFMIEASVAF
ncbi:hypothetical protein [Williamwhitmania taraxaci]|uniref:Phosphate-selective porin O and P n=1 Tax=Williamwhitmania taraxaci TaxID=1640674 RepID=A0A1G6LSP2_9BACT|nr:hypothetical protein [Williamwhitmania taraxaci]SDC46229.1 hypothetical protein SAMN05216323_103242 [Williamwhitmania taraxaci]